MQKWQPWLNVLGLIERYIFPHLPTCYISFWFTNTLFLTLFHASNQTSNQSLYHLGSTSCRIWSCFLVWREAQVGGDDGKHIAWDGTTYLLNLPAMILKLTNIHEICSEQIFALIILVPNPWCSQQVKKLCIRKIDVLPVIFGFFLIFP